MKKLTRDQEISSAKEGRQMAHEIKGMIADRFIRDATKEILMSKDGGIGGNAKHTVKTCSAIHTLVVQLLILAGDVIENPSIEIVPMDGSKKDNFLEFIKATLGDFATTAKDKMKREYSFAVAERRSDGL